MARAACTDSEVAVGHAMRQLRCVAPLWCVALRSGVSPGVAPPTPCRVLRSSGSPSTQYGYPALVYDGTMACQAVLHLLQGSSDPADLVVPDAVALGRPSVQHILEMRQALQRGAGGHFV